MNIKDSNRHFEKLSNFYQQISADGHLSPIELDLLKSYTRIFYESLLGQSTAQSNTPPVQKIERIQTPVASITPEAPEKTPVVEAIAEQAPVEAIVESSNEESSQQSKELDQLFSLETGTEISDKLSTTAIKDINKAMSINERIFTIKELFGGSQENFDKTISSLNEFNTYDDAKKYLSNQVVSENNWLDPEKNKKVKKFLKLISRKYV